MPGLSGDDGEDDRSEADWRARLARLSLPSPPPAAVDDSYPFGPRGNRPRQPHPRYEYPALTPSPDDPFWRQFSDPDPFSDRSGHSSLLSWGREQPIDAPAWMDPHRYLSTRSELSVAPVRVVLDRVISGMDRFAASGGAADFFAAATVAIAVARRAHRRSGPEGPRLRCRLVEESAGHLLLDPDFTERFLEPLGDVAWPMAAIQGSTTLEGGDEDRRAARQMAVPLQAIRAAYSPLLAECSLYGAVQEIVEDEDLADQARWADRVRRGDTGGQPMTLIDGVLCPLFEHPMEAVQYLRRERPAATEAARAALARLDSATFEAVFAYMNYVDGVTEHIAQEQVMADFRRRLEERSAHAEMRFALTKERLRKSWRDTLSECISIAQTIAAAFDSQDTDLLRTSVGEFGRAYRMLDPLPDDLEPDEREAFEFLDSVMKHVLGQSLNDLQLRPPKPGP